MVNAPLRVACCPGCGCVGGLNLELSAHKFVLSTPDLRIGDENVKDTYQSRHARSCSSSCCYEFYPVLRAADAIRFGSPASGLRRGVF